jgi:hypothetical protein
MARASSRSGMGPEISTEVLPPPAQKLPVAFFEVPHEGVALRGQRGHAVHDRGPGAVTSQTEGPPFLPTTNTRPRPGSPAPPAG